MFCGLALEALRDSFGGVRFRDGGFLEVGEGLENAAFAPAVASGVGGAFCALSAMLVLFWGVAGGVFRFFGGRLVML